MLAMLEVTNLAHRRQPPLWLRLCASPQPGRASSTKKWRQTVVHGPGWYLMCTWSSCNPQWQDLGRWPAHHTNGTEICWSQSLQSRHILTEYKAISCSEAMHAFQGSHSGPDVITRPQYEYTGRHGRQRAHLGTSRSCGAQDP